MKMRPWRHVNLQPRQHHLRDVNRHPAPEAQRRAKANSASRISGSPLPRWRQRRFHALHPRRRPDAQPLAHGRKPMHQRHVKIVQLHAGVKMVLQARHNARAQKRLSRVCRAISAATVSIASTANRRRPATGKTRCLRQIQPGPRSSSCLAFASIFAAKPDISPASAGAHLPKMRLYAVNCLSRMQPL